MSRNIKRRWVGSSEKLGVIVVNLDPADETGQTAGDDLSGVTVHIAIRAAGSEAAFSWLVSSWVGDPTNEGYAETDAEVVFTEGRFVVYVRLDGALGTIRDAYEIVVSP